MLPSNAPEKHWQNSGKTAANSFRRKFSIIKLRIERKTQRSEPEDSIACHRAIFYAFEEKITLSHNLFSQPAQSRSWA